MVQGPERHNHQGLTDDFIERVDLLNRPLRTRTVGGVGAASQKLLATRLGIGFTYQRLQFEDGCPISCSGCFAALPEQSFTGLTFQYASCAM